MLTPKEKLQKLTSYDTAPTLTDAEIDELLAASGTPDANGAAPGDETWTPTYDLNRGAAAGWLLKAAKASAMIEAETPGSGLYTSRIFDNCREMYRIFRAKSRMTVEIR